MGLNEILGSSNLFKGMSPGQIHTLAGACRRVAFGKGATLFTEGARGSAFYILLEGEVRLTKTSSGGQEVVVGIVRPPDVFAEVVVFENPSYPVTATALTDVKALAVDCRTFLGLLDEKAFRNDFMAMLMRKQRYLAGRILYLAAMDVEERFVRFLIERYGDHGVYRVDMAKKDIAGAIGTIPETFSRLVNRLRRQGVLSWEGDTLRLDRSYIELFTDGAGDGPDS